MTEKAVEDRRAKLNKRFQDKYGGSKTDFFKNFTFQVNDSDVPPPLNREEHLRRQKVWKEKELSDFNDKVKEGSSFTEFPTNRKW